MLVEIAIGDAYGAPYEFAGEEFIRENNDGKTYRSRTTKWGTDAGNGKYTDDTQMSIAIAMHHLSKSTVSQKEYVRQFLTVYKRDPRGRAGYSRRMAEVLESSFDIDIFQKNVPAISKGNGCTMRTVPLGLLESPKEVIEAAMVHATTTHATLDAVRATVFVSLMSHYMYHHIGPVDEMNIWIYSHMGNIKDILDAWEKGPVPVNAIKTASAVFQLVGEARTMTDLLKKCIEIGGDTDSTAAISLGLASLNSDIVNDLPKSLYQGLENGEYGKDYLVNLDIELGTYDLNINKDKWGVHRTHCCNDHGCKYGSRGCPVENGMLKQDYLCETCNEKYTNDDI